MNENAQTFKNLATCSEIEFLVQCNKIRKQTADWLKLCDFSNIRKNVPALQTIDDTLSDEEKAKVKAENDAKVKAQVKVNISEMLDAALEKNAAKTAELLALFCFVSPDEVHNGTVKMPFLLRNFFQMVQDDDVLGFFSDLINSGLITSLIASKQ